MGKKVFIISYSFPPNNAIGGRRWAKFAKELNRLNCDVKVLTFNNKNNNSFSNWVSDIESFKNDITYIPTNYPKWLDNPEGVQGKLLYKMSLLYVKCRLKGNYYDRASFLREQTIGTIEKYIKMGYNNIIVTCAPFKLGLWVSELIAKYPKINFIVDFRDPWTNNLTAYGLSSMSKKRINYELFCEQQVINRFGKITVVAEEMKKYFEEKYAVSNDKIQVINNGFDEDDFKNSTLVDDTFFKKQGKMKIVFTGSFYEKASYLLKELVQVISTNKKFTEKFEFHFFGNMPNEALKIINILPDNFYYHGFIELKNIYSIISKSDFCALFLTDDINYSLSTKFLEYLSQGKKIVVFSKGGPTADFIESNYLGISVNSNEMYQSLCRLVKMYDNKEIDMSIPKIIDDFNIKSLVKKIELLLI